MLKLQSIYNEVLQKINDQSTKPSHDEVKNAIKYINIVRDGSDNLAIQCFLNELKDEISIENEERIRRFDKYTYHSKCL